MDPKGGGVPGAKVTVTNQDTGVAHDTVASAEGFIESASCRLASIRLRSKLQDSRNLPPTMWEWKRSSRADLT